MDITAEMIKRGFREIKDKVYPDLLFFTKGHLNSENMMAIICVDPKYCDIDNIVQTYDNFVEREDGTLRT